MTVSVKRGSSERRTLRPTPTTQCAQQHNCALTPRAAIDCEREGTDLRLNNFGAMHLGKRVLAGRYRISTSITTHVGCCTAILYYIILLLLHQDNTHIIVRHLAGPSRRYSGYGYWPLR